MKHWKLWLGILIGVWIDMGSKYLFYNLKYLEHTSTIRPALNTGISRSLPVPLLRITIISILGLAAFIWLYKNKKIDRILAALLIAGTIGNLIDRIIYAGVRDFINIWFFNFPIFNFADIMLSIGVGIRIIRVILEKKK